MITVKKIRSTVVLTSNWIAAKFNEIYSTLVNHEGRIVDLEGSIGNSISHNSTINRDAENAHPISAITNLATELGSKEPANANIQSHISSTGNPHGLTITDIGAQKDLTAITSAIESAKVILNGNISIPFASTISLNLANDATFDIGALTGNITNLTATGMVAGMTFLIEVIQDNVGGRSIALDNAIFDRAFGAATINTTANKPSWIGCRVRNDLKISYSIVKGL